MRLVKRFLVGDIIEYELDDLDILESLSYGNTDTIIDCLVMGNKCSYEEAYEIFKQAKDEYEFVEIINLLIIELIGVDNTKESSKETDDKSENTERKKYSDCLIDYYNELQKYDSKLDWNTFTNMSTRMLHKYAEGVKRRYIDNENKKLKNFYEFICMFFSAFTGKLKECPQISENGESNKQSLIEKLKAMSNRGGV